MKVSRSAFLFLRLHDRHKTEWTNKGGEMLSIGTKKRQSLFLISALTCFLVLFLVPGTTNAAPKGKITIAIPTAFEMTGGDPHTNTGATG
ncbi:MAG: hypothetical protein V3V52_04995, partial [Candidatus Adiutricales bacterium]